MSTKFFSGKTFNNDTDVIIPWRSVSHITDAKADPMNEDDEPSCWIQMNNGKVVRVASPYSEVIKDFLSSL